MSYLTYNGKLILSDNKFAIGETFKLADFDNDTITFSTSNQASILGDMKLNFKLYLDSLINSTRVLQLKGSTTDFFKISIKDSTVYISVATSYPPYYTSYQLGPQHNQTILNCEVRKNPYAAGNAKNYPIYFLVNDVSLSGTNVFGGASASVGPLFGVGAGASSFDAISFTNDMDNGTIWDIGITEVSTGIQKHLWKGYGNTLGDWQDLIGGVNATVIDPMGTRTVPGFVPS
jgi:hypothetical protein